MAPKKKVLKPRTDIRVVIEAASPRPPDDASQNKKRGYAEQLSHHLAKILAEDLQAVFGDDTIRAGESRAGSASGAKKLDVNFSDDLHGLKLGVSIKTISHRDKNGTGTYTKNRKRVDEEFLAEALDYHVRQPYAVLIGLYFLPNDSCDDGTERRNSSFGQWVSKLFFRAGRRDPRHNPELFERIYVGLFDQSSGAVRFFDVERPPPRQGHPPDVDLITWQHLLGRIEGEYSLRNARFKWADSSEPVENDTVIDDDEDSDEEA